MPPDSLPDPLVRETAQWLRYAHDDLTAARILLAQPGLPPRLSAWHAQQAAEKAIKAALIAERQAFPFVHDLLKLLALVPPTWRVRHVDADLSTLTDYAVEARYPDDLPDVSAAEAESAVADANRVVEAVSDDLGPLLAGE